MTRWSLGSLHLKLLHTSSFWTMPTCISKIEHKYSYCQTSPSNLQTYSPTLSYTGKERAEETLGQGTKHHDQMSSPSQENGTQRKQFFSLSFCYDPFGRPIIITNHTCGTHKLNSQKAHSLSSTWPQKIIIITSPLSMLSCTKPSVRSQTSSARMATTGKSFAPTLPTPWPQGRLTKPPHYHIERSCATRLPKQQAILPLSHSFKQTLIVLSSSLSNMMTFGECTRRQKLPSGPLKRLTSRLTPRIGTGYWWWSNTSSCMFLPSLLLLMALSMKTSAATSWQKSHPWKPGVFMASKLPSKTSTVRHTHSSLTHMSRTPQQKCTSYKQSKLYHSTPL